MDWGQVLTIIFGIAGFMSFFMFLINKRIDSVEKRIDDLRQDIERRFDYTNKRLDKLEEDTREIRQLLYKVLGVENKKD